MKVHFKKIFQFFLIILLMLIEGHLAALVHFFVNGHITIFPMLFLAAFYYFCKQFKMTTSCLLAVFLGMLYDYHYFAYLGIMVIILPVITLFALAISRFLEYRWRYFEEILILLIYLFLVQVTAYFLLRCYHRIFVDWTYFITFHLLPSLLVTIFAAVIGKKLLNQLFV
ncbi:rod shape-determining protein MreD [Streptococcus halichoeri]|uniref:rod shape-determining protein MreD n=1 Tax=Streptococcus halichoeri TaxID=254785 RepID=UPI00135B5DA5|nr:rod shape-determining protein MreD [Streptococcus halichoeri]